MAASKCVNCGANIPASASFCSNCGAQKADQPFTQPMATAPALEPGFRGPSSMALTGDEKVIWFGRRCWESLIGKIITGIILIILWLVIGSILGAIGFFIFFLIFGIIGLIQIVSAILLNIGSEYIITNHRVYMRYGIIRRLVSETNFKKITNTIFVQNIWGRLLNYGRVGVNTAGTSAHDIIYIGAKNPEMVLNILRDHIKIGEKHERRLGRIERMKDKFYTGEISAAQFEEAKKKIESEDSID